jgi:hypothetical protein
VLAPARVPEAERGEHFELYYERDLKLICLSG